LSISDGLRSSEYWQERAEEARARADEMRDQEARAMMLSIAHMYDLMAARAAQRENPPNKRV
jgi:hypothetical protein